MGYIYQVVQDFATIQAWKFGITWKFDHFKKVGDVKLLISRTI
jgi:hypothetical protein